MATKLDEEEGEAGASADLLEDCAKLDEEGEAATSADLGVVDESPFFLFFLLRGKSRGAART